MKRFAVQDSILVAGYPLGGDSLSITKGIVSRVTMTRYAHASNKLLGIQIDAAINPGNSGGPAFADLQTGKVCLLDNAVSGSATAYQHAQHACTCAEHDSACCWAWSTAHALMFSCCRLLVWPSPSCRMLTMLVRASLSVQQAAICPCCRHLQFQTFKIGVMMRLGIKPALLGQPHVILTRLCKLHECKSCNPACTSC